MIALKHFLEAIAYVLGWALDIYMWLIIARAVLSWVNPDPYNPMVGMASQPHACEVTYRFLDSTLPGMGWVPAGELGGERVPFSGGGVTILRQR